MLQNCTCNKLSKLSSQYYGLLIKINNSGSMKKNPTGKNTKN